MSVTMTGAVLPVKVIVEDSSNNPITNFGYVDVPVAEVVGDAVATKPEIAALTSASTAADIVAALKA